jgi:DNA-directed RNA polymerase specialized sigma24 family protein
MVIEKTQTVTREELFIHLYETAFPKVATFVHKMGGSFEEAKDIFQDALIIYYEKNGVLHPGEENNETHYLLGIARHLWYKKYRENKVLRSLSALPDLKLPSEEPKVSESILRFVELSGKKCLALLRSFYYEKLNMKELADKFGFSGERSAAAQKYKCLEKVRNTIQERSLNKEDFYE